MRNIAAFAAMLRNAAVPLNPPCPDPRIECRTLLTSTSPQRPRYPEAASPLGPAFEDEGLTALDKQGVTL